MFGELDAQGIVEAVADGSLGERIAAAVEARGARSPPASVR